MKLSRRRFLHLVSGAAALQAVARVAWAQVYPSRPVRIVVGFPAGGQIEIIARLIGQWLSDRLGQQFFIDNRPGAASNIAADAVVRAPADGHTLLSFATLRRSPASTAFRSSWKRIPHFRPRRFPN
jgi:tripartite-type tricarboxylate transporter receptor subunit TctC